MYLQFTFRAKHNNYSECLEINWLATVIQHSSSVCMIWLIIMCMSQKIWVPQSHAIPPLPASIYLGLLSNMCKQSFPRFTNSVPASVFIKVYLLEGYHALYACCYTLIKIMVINLTWHHSQFSICTEHPYTETQISKASTVLYDHFSEKDSRYWTLKHGTECSLIRHFTVALCVVHISWTICIKSNTSVQSRRAIMLMSGT